MSILEVMEVVAATEEVMEVVMEEVVMEEVGVVEVTEVMEEVGDQVLQHMVWVQEEDGMEDMEGMVIHTATATLTLFTTKRDARMLAIENSQVTRQV